MRKSPEIEINDYEKPINELVGKSIIDVNYYEIDYGKPMWNESEFHTLDFGLEIIMSDKTCYYFIWDSKFTQFDIKFGKGSISKELNSEHYPKKQSVKNEQKWVDLIGQEISGTKSFWSYWTLNNDDKKNHYPQDIKLKFDNGKEIWISALEIKNDSPIGMTDNITVIFDKEAADKFKIGMKNVV